MKVPCRAHHNRLVRLDPLDLVPPLPRNLDRRLDRLRAGVHRQHHVKAKHARDKVGKARKDIVVEGAAAQRQAGRLVGEHPDELRVAVALVDGAVGGQEVEVALALGIPHVHASGTAGDERDGVVVVCGVGVFEGDGFGGAAGVEAGRVGWCCCRCGSVGGFGGVE